MYGFTDDPVADYMSEDNENSKWLDRLPCCDCCGEPIQQEKAVYYNDQWFCKECEEEAWECIRKEYLERTDLE